MPLNNSHFDSLFAITDSLNETELEALAEVCQAKAKEKKKARREALRQELMENLQKAISNILDNDFALTIENTDDPIWKVCFGPQDNCHIEIE